MSESSKAIHVLHVDDDPALADVSATFLERENSRINVQTATSPTDGLELLAEHDIDCIVSDYDMPEQNGIEFLEVVREQYADLPFILYTGKGSEEVASEAISTGVTDYLQKETGSSQYTVLANRISNAVEQYRSRQAVQETEQKLSELAERTDDILFIFDGDWSELLFINSAYEAVWGRSIEELKKNPESFLEHVHPEDLEKGRASMEQLATGEASQIEYRIIRPDGEQRWVRGDTQPILDQDGTVVRIVGQVRDITEQKERELHLETIIDNLPGYVYRHAYESEYPLQFVKGDAESITGYTATELAEDVILAENIIHPDEREELWEEHIEGIESTGRSDLTYRIITKDGDVRWIHDQGQLIEDPVTGEDVIEGFITDVSAHIQREQELEQTNALLSTLIETLPVGVLAEDESRNVLAVNERLVELFGRAGTPEEFAGADCERMAEEVSDMFVESESFVQRTNELITERKSVSDEELLLQDGRTFARNHEPIKLPDGEGHLWAYRDITERKEREQQLEQYEQIVETMDDIAFIVDDEWTIAFTNKSIAEYIDISLDALNGQSVMRLANEYITEEGGPERFEQALERAFEQGDGPDSPERVELTLDTDSGQMTFEYQFSPLVSDGETRAVVITMRDITKHMQHAEQLRALNERSQMLMSADTKEQIAEIGVEATREILELDANAIHLYDMEQSGLVPVAATDTVYELVGEPPVFTPGDSIAWRAYEQDEALAFDDIQDEPDIYDPKTPIRSELHLPLGNHGILLAGSPTVAAFGEQEFMLGRLLAANIASALDQVTQTEHLHAREAELTRQNNQLEKFASIVSHDLRNPLNVAEARVELAAEEYEGEHLEHAERALARMDALIEDILTLAREGEEVTDLERVDITTIAESCWANVETADATLVIDTERTVYADRSRLKQLFENLICNAVEHGGRDVTVTVGSLADGFYVEDNGPGIPEGEREEVFDAGYSTSEQGTGFGLNIVKQIVDAHGWTAHVDESAEGGARFEITDIRGERSGLQSWQ